MEFGFTLKPDHPLERVMSLTRLAEDSGFTHGWVFDCHVLWKEPYPLLTLMAQNSARLRLGTCVTNPATREPTVTASTLAVLQEISGGRMDLGIGRGDSARRVLGKPPTSLEHARAGDHVIRDLCEGREASVRGHVAPPLDWAPDYHLPLWIAGYGPKAIELTGRSPTARSSSSPTPTCRLFVGSSTRGRARGRPRPERARRSWPPRRRTSGPRLCARRMRWFPALVSNHVVDLVKRYASRACRRP